jgi:hypothetical protein
MRLQRRSKPYWIELGYGVAHLVRPLSSAMTAALRAKATRLSREMLEADEAERLADLIDVEGLEDEEIIAGLSEMYFATALARAATMEWRGWEDEAGEPLPLTERNIAAAMRQPFMAQAFLTSYLAPDQALVDEGNGSAPPPNGTTGVARNTAQAAVN